VERYDRARQTTDDSIIRRMRFARWIPEATNTLGICNTYCFSKARMVTRLRLNVTFIRTLPVLFFPKINDFLFIYLHSHYYFPRHTVKTDRHFELTTTYGRPTNVEVARSLRSLDRKIL
jgi:hypothetical protein